MIEYLNILTSLLNYLYCLFESVVQVVHWIVHFFQRCFERNFMTRWKKRSVQSYTSLGHHRLERLPFVRILKMSWVCQVATLFWSGFRGVIGRVGCFFLDQLGAMHSTPGCNRSSPAGAEQHLPADPTPKPYETLILPLVNGVQYPRFRQWACSLSTCWGGWQLILHRNAWCPIIFRNAFKMISFPLGFRWILDHLLECPRKFVNA